MKKYDFGRFFDNRRLMILFSIFLAIISWFIVGYAIDTSTVVPISDVPVDITASQTDVLSANGLKILEGDVPRVNVMITGERYIIGGIVASDVSIVADLSGITAPGTYNNIKLIGTDKFGKGFKVDKISPSVITLKIDRPITKKFTITTDIEGLRIPDGYIGLDTVVSPKEVTITGPEADVSKIDKCVVAARFTDPLTKNTTIKSNIVLYDSEGNELSKDLLTMDNETADLTVPVLKQKRLPVTIDFLNAPPAFPLDQLKYTLSQDHILVAGPEALIDSYEELNIGYVNINEIKSGGFAQTFEISLPNGFLNVDNVKSIDVIFNTQDMEEAPFTITNIKAINIPVNVDVTVNTSQITGVTIVGDPNVMKALSAKDLVAEIDISEREVTPGPYNLPVHISAPGKGLVWATGVYSAVVTITEK
ncbi:CdaR family protein [Oscillospiraceae bacterium PP1C4]